MGTEVADKLLAQGPMGLLCLIIMGACWVLYKDKKAGDKERADDKELHEKILAEMRSRHDVQIDAMRDKHDTAIREWQDRYTAKTDKMNDKAMEQNERLVTLTEMLERRFSSERKE